MAKTGVISASQRTEMHSAQAANSQPEPNDAFAELHNFVFDDGETLASLKLHYLTLGTPRRDASGAIANGVLLLHGPAGSAAYSLSAVGLGGGDPIEQPPGLFGGGEQQHYVGRSHRVAHVVTIEPHAPGRIN